MAVRDTREPSDAGASASSRLAREIEERASGERELRRLLRDAYEQIAERDEEIARLEGERRRLDEQATAAYAEMRYMKSRRVWRAGATYWALRDLLRPRRRER